MKWSELPKEYRDLENGFDDLFLLDKENESIISRFVWGSTPQGHDFWKQCFLAETISELPPIPKSNQKCQD